MKPLMLGSRDPLVGRVQHFLRGRGYYLGEADNHFGPATRDAVRKFQADAKLKADGIVGNDTLAVMMSRGFALIAPNALPGQFPQKPSFPPLSSNAERAAVFGKFEYVSAPEPGNPEAIRILGNWEEENIETFVVPQLVTATVSQTGRVRFHRKGKAQLLALWAAWESAGLLKQVKSWEGAYVPRFVRGSRTTLSNHAFGSAFDINYQGNELGRVPAPTGSPRSVRELVPLAHEHGFYWGGHFSRADGMHFEIAKLLS
jgi:hypothetical protein